MMESLNFNNFALASHYCRQESRGGGVGIWTRLHVDSDPLNIERFCIEKVFEVCGVTCNLEGFIYVILCCYRSPSANWQAFLGRLQDVLQFVFRTNRRILLCGDFNCDSVDGGEYIQLTNVCQEFNLCNIVNDYTRVTKTSASIIDHIFVNFSYGKVQVVDNVVSDHRSIFAELDVYVQGKCTSFFTRYFGDDSISEFRLALCRVDWTELYILRDMDAAFSHFFGVFKYYFDLFFPIQKCYSTEKGKQWVNSDIKASSENLRFLYQLAKTNDNLKEYYTDQKKKHKQLINNTKKDYYQQKISDASNSVTCAWRIVNELSNKEKKRKNLLIKVANLGSITDCPETIANSFSLFFRDAPIKIAQNIPKIANGVNFYQVGYPNIENKKILLFPFQQEEFYTLIMSKLKNKKSSGADDIPSFIVREVLAEIANPMTFLINLSFCTGQFPSSLRLGKIIPIYKKGDVHLMDNYRPVTVCSSFSKLFEYCFLDRMLMFIQENGIISTHQFGFQSGKSTGNAMHTLYSEIVHFMEEGESPVGVFCDLSRAFDCVNQDLLLDKLSYCGFKDRAFQWIESFIRGRKHYVSIDHVQSGTRVNINSECASLQMGVPQGSVLGPVLFILYVNELPRVLPDVSFTAFADDTSLILSKEDDKLLEEKVNLSISGLWDWFASNDLYFNLNKTKCVRFHPRQRQCDRLEFKLNDLKISNENSVKFLGIYVDAHLDWKEQCDYVISKLNSSYYMILNLRNVLTRKQLLMLYYARVESVLRYGLSLWGYSTKCAEVFLKQKRIVRCIAGVSCRTSCRELFKQYNILTLTGLYIMETCVHIYRNRDNYLKYKDVHPINTRNADKYYVAPYKTQIMYKSPDVIGLEMFNRLPPVIKTSVNINQFKSQLKMYLISKCYYRLDEYMSIDI